MTPFSYFDALQTEAQRSFWETKSYNIVVLVLPGRRERLYLALPCAGFATSRISVLCRHYSSILDERHDHNTGVQR